MGCGDIRKPAQELTEAIERGHLAVFLHGRKLIGGYALTRIGPPGGRERGLLVKEADGYADRAGDPVRSNPESLMPGRVNDEPTPSTDGPHAAERPSSVLGSKTHDGASRPLACRKCGTGLAGARQTRAERRQVTEIPPVKAEVTEHQRIERECPCCGERTRADAPGGVTAPV